MEFPAFMYELHGTRCLMCGSEGLIYMKGRVVNNKFLSTATLDALKVRGGSYYIYMYMSPFLILKVRHPAVTGVYCIVRDSRSGCSNDFKRVNSIGEIGKTTTY